MASGMVQVTLWVMVLAIASATAPGILLEMAQGMGTVRGTMLAWVPVKPWVLESVREGGCLSR